MAVAALIVAGTVVLVALRGSDEPPPATLSPGAGQPASDPLAWTPERSDEYARRARDGWSHALYTRTADGLALGLERTMARRDAIERATQGSDVDPDTLEAMVLLESAGRPEARASDDLAGAVGLTQILAETGQSLLGMKVDVEASEEIGKQMDRAAKNGNLDRVEWLRGQRRKVDERFDPQKSLAATVRYLEFAQEQLGRDDLAVASYHMGVGNLQTALARYGGDDELPYVQLYFDSTPSDHTEAWEFLNGLGDDSSTYLWRVEAAKEILRLAREDPEELERRTQLMNARNSAEVLLHPPDDTRYYEDPDDLQSGYDDGDLVPLPARYLGRHGIRIDRQMGELAPKLDQEPELYRGLRRETLATAAYIGSGVQAISGEEAPLRITSTVRDTTYQDELRGVEIQATDDYSLHTTGFAFDISRDYASRDQALALQFLLDRLTAMDLIAWVREPGAIHVTVADDAARLMGPMGVLSADAEVDEG